MAATFFFVVPARIGVMVLAAFVIIATIVHAVVARRFWAIIAYETNPGSPVKCAAVLIILQCIVRVLFSAAASAGALMGNSMVTLGAFGLTVLGLLLSCIEMLNAAISSDSLNLAVLVLMSTCLWIYCNLKIWECYKDSDSKK